ncbi:hypothetical protein Sjap_007060 [Stephania japonica]|uniref:Thioesterase domain-containing protein n=1 Tax=Stephania japonica TaxID=461633 RepID=A0AAP0PKC0_9MAGN
MGGLDAKKAVLDLPLHTIGFEIEELSPKRVAGRMKVTEKCCQPFKVLHGGVSALVAEALGSIGAHMASGLQRVAGIHLSINHVKQAEVGDTVTAEATPVHVGRTIQVWEVQIRKIIDPLNPGNGALLSSSRVTLLCNMPVPDNAKDAGLTLKKFPAVKESITAMLKLRLQSRGSQVPYFEQALGLRFCEHVKPADLMPFKVLHGGVSALVAEALASMGAMIASDLKRVAGIQLSINHVKQAELGDMVVAEATPTHVGRTIQVWEVQIRKIDPLNPGNGALISSSRVTLLCNMPVPENANDAGVTLKKYAKL